MGVALVMRTFLLTSGPSQNNEAGGRFAESYTKVCVVAFALNLMCMVASSCDGRSVSLEDRVKEYWKLRVEVKAEQSYEFEAPGVPEKQAYLKKIHTAPIVFLKCTIQSIKENGDEAVVALQAEYLLPGLSRPVSSSMAERWVRNRGQWYHHFESGDNGTDTERG